MSLTPNDDILAAELVLGLLEGADEAAAWERQAAEPAFARAVAYWEARFAEMAAALDPVEPRATLKISVLERATGGAASTQADAKVETDAQPPAAARRPLPDGRGTVAPGRARRDPVRVWQLAAAGLGALALTELALLLLWAAPEDEAPVIVAAPPEPAAASSPLIAALVPAETSQPVIASLDLPANTLSVDPSGIDPGEGAVELWLLPADGGAPVSLGLLVPNTDNRVTIQIAGFEGDALPSLAISLEPEGGSPTGAPTGPVVASGPVRRL